jgi:hypothetical protein
MTPSKLSIGNAISVSPRAARIVSADGDTVSEHVSSGGASLHRRAPQDAARELAYGCVDWFIYVTDSVTIGPMTRVAGND